jgi:hypothetical protein
MADVFEMKRGDRRPYYRVQLLVTDPLDPDGPMIPMDLTDATSVRFLMKTSVGSLVVDDLGTFIDRVNGIVQYAWGAGDTDVSNPNYQMEVEVDWGGEKQTFPSVGYYQVSITDDLNPV